MENLKYCSNKNCKEKNPQPLSNFRKNKNSKDGYTYRCKSCLRYSAREYYNKNSESILKLNNKWKSKNRDKCKAYNKKWHEENRKHRS